MCMYAFLTKQCLNVELGESPSSIWWCEPKSAFETYILAFGILSALVVISICVVDIDIVVSAFVARRYHLDFRRRGSRVGVLQILYPVVHIIYRIAEVVARISLLTACVLVSGFELHLSGFIAACSLIAVDFLIVLLILRKYSPRSERWAIHFFVALGFLIADMAKFVDRPGFSYPARHISLAIGRWERESWRSQEWMSSAMFNPCCSAFQVAEAAASSGLRNSLCCNSLGRELGEDA